MTDNKINLPIRHIKMTEPSKQQLKFINLLRELFQLNQPDLDFGLYRIMHAKAAEIEKFLDEDLLAVISKTFAGGVDEKIARAKDTYEKELQNATEYGVADPVNSPKAQQALAAYNEARNSAGEDAEIYDHLYRFFERYYDQGDFLSRRYYARETSEKAAPYAVPYDGSEVYLHWANKDQYYIKTTESFNQFSFNLALAQDGNAQLFSDATPRKVHFKLVDAEEGEHNNVKATSDKDRFFIVDQSQPIDWEATAAGEYALVVIFHYCADAEKPSNARNWRNTRNAKNQQVVLDALQAEAKSKNEQALLAQNYHAALAKEVSKGSKAGETQPLIARYLNQYTASNTMDYFIHKDLGGFLKRELDFYLKNEVLRLDDLGTADQPQPDNYTTLLKKLHTLRSIAHKLIDFLAQTEEFQKKLWLKKKFVVATHYCITLDRNPESFYAKIAANEQQWAQWGELGMLEGDKNDLFKQAKAGSVEYLKDHPYLMADTALFNVEFKDALLATIDNLDESLDGLLIHGDNFQALNLLQKRYRAQVKCIYIDPPYNTGSDGFIYKDSYEHSSWLTMFSNRILAASTLQSENSWLAVSIDEREHHRMLSLLESYYGEQNIVSTVTVKMSHLSGMKMAHIDKKPPKIKEYLSLISNSVTNKLNPVYEKSEWDDVFDRYGSVLIKGLNASDVSKWTKLPLRQFAMKNGINVKNTKEYDEFKHKYASIIFRTAVNDSESFNSSPSDGLFHEVLTPTGLKKYAHNGEEVLFANDKLKIIDGKLEPVKIKGDIWEDIGINNLHNEGAVIMPNGKKPVKLIERVCRMFTSPTDLALDYFAGSGTTGHAVINLNREDKGKRKYILVEQGKYFETATKPRIQKVVYSADWTDGKPTAPKTGVSHAFKVIKLESYEDTLNNLQISDEKERQTAIESNSNLREAYYLNYLLEMETQGSASLLNISAFSDPTAYQLNIKSAGSDAQVSQAVDLLETFNWLIGLRVKKLHAPVRFNANLAREDDTDLPAGSTTRLSLKGKLQEDANGAWWFRSVEGVVKNAAGLEREQRVLIVWRKLTGNLEQDNTVLAAYLAEHHIIDVQKLTLEVPYDVIYINGSHNLPMLAQCDIRLLEDTFHQKMWDVKDV